MPEFNEPGTAAKLLEEATKTAENQKVSDEKLAAAQTKAADQDKIEAARFTEEIIAWLNREFTNRNFTTEQKIFAFQLTAINMRQNFPDERGGKAYFDSVGKEAWAYFENAKG